MKDKKYNSMRLKNKIIALALINLLVITTICYFPFPSKDEIQPNKRKRNESYKETKEIINKVSTSSAIELWNRTFGSSKNEAGMDIVVDSDGNIYIAGDEDGTNMVSDDVVLVKYNSSGHYQWDRPFRGWDNYEQQVTNGIAVDSSDNIYMTGRDNSRPPEYGSDVFLLRYNSSGDKEWEKYWHKNADDGYDVIVDSNDNVYVSGTVWYTQESRNLFLLKYNISGDLEWERELGGGSTDTGCGIAIDSYNNIYITGFTKSFDMGGGGDAWLVKYNSSGHYQWNRTWGGPYLDRGFSVDIDSKDNIYIAGLSDTRGLDEYDLLLIKYNSTGHYQWNKTWGGTGDEGYKEEPVGVTVDQFDKIIVCGWTESFDLPDSQLVLLKYNTSGGLIWERMWGGDDREIGYCVDTDKFGNIYASGRSDSFSDNVDMVLVKFSQTPEAFNLTSSADTPDTNGEFLLNWTTLEKGLNYSVYVSDNYITEIDDTVECINSNLKSSTFSISGLQDGTYYYKAVAFNEYGNSSSNCIQIDVQLSPPGDFNLFTNANNPDRDGSFCLNWTSAYEANNYSIHQADKYISEINDTVYEIITGATNLSFYISGKDTGNYYYMVVAYNNFGNTSSNCILVSVIHGPPGTFTLSISGIETYYDTNGDFDLNWESAESADNYSIYYSRYAINDIDDNDILIANGLQSLTYHIDGMDNAFNHYFAIVAINVYGGTLSNDEAVWVYRPDPQNAKPGFFELITDAGDPDNNGDFYINWGVANGADDYTLYQSNSFIYESDLASCTIIVEGNTNRTFHMSGVSNGIYYYRVVAFNENGNRISACLQIIVELGSLGSFTLYTSKTNLESDSIFNLYWDNSDGAFNYSLYWSNESITNFDSNVYCIIKSNTNRSIYLSIFDSGKYYFIIVAFNPFANISSNCIEIQVQPTSDDGIVNGGTPDGGGGGNGGGSNNKIIPFGSFYLIYLAFGILSTILLYKKKFKKSKI